MTLEGALIPACAPPLDIIPGVQQLPDSRRWRPTGGASGFLPHPTTTPRACGFGCAGRAILKDCSPARRAI
jgi:hypothetical protein